MRTSKQNSQIVNGKLTSQTNFQNYDDICYLRVKDEMDTTRDK